MTFPTTTSPTTSSVLVVDDDAAIRSVVGEALDMIGYRVLVAADGAEALAVLERERPCAVLLDMRMPVLDGWGFAREARRRGHRFPIAVMTAADNAQTWCDEVDGDACLAKPFDVSALFETVDRLCKTGP
ncbi:MAG TPA: response regulator [Chloroflexota bacterium]|jgi:CheY-like chemotaxis protein